MTANQVKILQVIKDNGPICAPQILKTLKKQNITLNKTTIYRNLSSLIDKKLLREVRVEPEKSFYESAELEHHHHFICQDCGKIKKVMNTELERVLSKVEASLKASGMKINKHDVEFFGRCNTCH